MPKIILEMNLSAQCLSWIQQLLETLEYGKGMTDCTISTQFVPLNCSFRFPFTGQFPIDTPQRPRIDLNKRFLPRPNTTTA